MSVKKYLVLFALLMLVAGFVFAEEAEQTPKAAKKLTPVELMKKYGNYILVKKSSSSTDRITQQIQVRIEGMGNANRIFSSMGDSDEMALLISKDTIMFPHSSSSSGGFVMIQGDAQNGDEGDGNKEIGIHIPGGKDVDARTIGALKKDSLGFALVNLPEDAGVKQLNFGASNISIGQEVYIIGRRKSEWKYATFYLKGEINGQLPLENQNAFSISIPQNQLEKEALGAVVVDASGNLLGIVKEFRGKTLSVGVVRPDFFTDKIKIALETPEDLDPYQENAQMGIRGMVPGPQVEIEEEPEEKPFLGVSVQAVTQEKAKELGMEKATGLLVKTVTDDSPAAKAGLKEGDVILEADGVVMQTSEELRELIILHEPGEEMEFVVLREGKQFTLKATLAKR